MMDKKRSVGIIVIGIFDIICSLPLLALAVMLQGSPFHALLGTLYLLIGGLVLALEKVVRKMFLYGVIPLSILASLQIITLSRKDIPPGFQTPIKEGLIIIGITVVFPFLLNIYFFTRPKSKGAV